MEGGKHQVSVCAGAPAVLGWATGNLAEPRNNPQIGMANMRAIMPALQKAKARRSSTANGLSYVSVSLPKQQRETRVEKNMSARRDCARTGGVDRSGVSTMETILVLTHVDETGSALTQSLAGGRDRRRGAGARNSRLR